MLCADYKLAFIEACHKIFFLCRAEQMQVPAVSFTNESTNQPKKKKPAQMEDRIEVAPPTVSQTTHSVTASPSKPQKRTHDELTSPKSKKPKTSVSGEELTNKHKEKQVSETTKTEKKNKSQTQKKKHKKKKPKSVGPVMSDERLKAFGINPKKYKYEFLKSLHEQNTTKNGS